MSYWNYVTICSLKLTYFWKDTIELWGLHLTRKYKLELFYFSRRTRTFSSLNLKPCRMISLLRPSVLDFDWKFLVCIMLKTHSWTFTVHLLKLKLFSSTEYTLKTIKLNLDCFLTIFFQNMWTNSCFIPATKIFLKKKSMVYL